LLSRRPFALDVGPRLDPVDEREVGAGLDVHVTAADRLVEAHGRNDIRSRIDDEVAVEPVADRGTTFQPKT